MVFGCQIAVPGLQVGRIAAIARGQRLGWVPARPHDAPVGEPRPKSRNSGPRSGRLVVRPVILTGMNDNPYQTTDEDEAARAKRFERGAVRFAKFAFYFLIFVVLVFAGMVAVFFAVTAGR